MTSRDRPEEDADDLAIVSEAMIEAGIRRLAEHQFLDNPAEVVSAIYMAMEYQRKREASSVISRT